MRIYISKSLEEGHPVLVWGQENGHVIIHEAMIDQCLLSEQMEMPESSWIFFSSPSSASLFATAYPKQLANRKVAAIGKGTARYLHTHCKVLFEGSIASTEAVSEAFCSYIENETVLFPQSQISRRSVQQYCPPDQVKDFLFYETIPAGKPLDADLYFFTSPSNVTAFAEHNTMREGAKYLAIGDSTASSLQELGFPVHGAPSSWKASDWLQLLKEQTPD